jgi:hypothetical protein
MSTEDIISRSKVLAVRDRILVSAPRESVQGYLRDIKNLPLYDGRVESIDLAESLPEGIAFTATGRWAGLPWKGEFRLEFTPDGGYRLFMLSGPLKFISSTFHLRPVSGGTVVTHEQSYHLSVLLRPLFPVIKHAASHSLERQLWVIKEGAELLHRRLQLRLAETL